MSRRFSTGTCPVVKDDPMMAMLPDNPNNGLRRCQRQSVPDSEREVEPCNPRRMFRRISCPDTDRDSLGEMRRTLRRGSTDERRSFETLTDEGRSSERFQSGRTYLSQSENDVAKPKLERIQLFQQCTPTFMEALSHQLENAFFQAGEEIMKQGDFGSAMYLLNFGEVEVVVGEGVVVATLGSGAMFGEMAVICKNPAAAKRTATIRAKLYCHCWSIGRSAIFKLFSVYPKDEMVISTEADRRLQDLIQKGFVKDPALDKKDDFRQQPNMASVPNGWKARVRNKLKALTVFSKVSRPATSDEHDKDSSGTVTPRVRRASKTLDEKILRRVSEDLGRNSYESGTSRCTFESVGRHTGDLAQDARQSYESVSLRSYKSLRRASEDLGRISYETGVSRCTFDSVGRQSFGPVDNERQSLGAQNSSDYTSEAAESARCTFDEYRCEHVSKKSAEEVELFKDEDDMLDPCRGLPVKVHGWNLGGATVAKLLQNGEDRLSNMTTQPSVFCEDEERFSPTKSDEDKYPAGWACGALSSRRLPPQANEKHKHSQRCGWSVGETAEVTKARSTAQSFLAKRGIGCITGTRGKIVPLDVLFGCIPSNR